MEKETFTVAYSHKMRPSQYDERHFICYLNETPADYKADEKAKPISGFAYTGNMSDGGTLVECDEFDRDKLINAVIRTRYSQTQEDAIKTHHLNVLAEKTGISTVVPMSDGKLKEYEEEWYHFELFRTEVIRTVDGWLAMK